MFVDGGFGVVVVWAAVVVGSGGGFGVVVVWTLEVVEVVGRVGSGGSGSVVVGKVGTGSVVVGKVGTGNPSATPTPAHVPVAKRVMRRAADRITCWINDHRRGLGTPVRL